MITKREIGDKLREGAILANLPLKKGMRFLFTLFSYLMYKISRHFFSQFQWYEVNSELNMNYTSAFASFNLIFCAI